MGALPIMLRLGYDVNMSHRGEGDPGTLFRSCVPGFPCQGLLVVLSMPCALEVTGHIQPPRQGRRNDFSVLNRVSTHISENSSAGKSCLVKECLFTPEKRVRGIKITEEETVISHEL